MRQWVHVTWGTYGTWLPGDPRGFHSRGHRIHSSGDYPHPPPVDQHRGLYEFSQRMLQESPVILDQEVREFLAGAIVSKLKSEELKWECLCVSATHVHILLMGLPHDLRANIGKLKRSSSHAVRARLPGRVWARGDGQLPVRDEPHFERARKYIVDHREAEGAAVRMHVTTRTSGFGQGPHPQLVNKESVSL